MELVQKWLDQRTSHNNDLEKVQPKDENALDFLEKLLIAS